MYYPPGLANRTGRLNHNLLSRSDERDGSTKRAYTLTFHRKGRKRVAKEDFIIKMLPLNHGHAG